MALTPAPAATVGIDLAAQDARTAAVRLSWAGGIGTDAGLPPLENTSDATLVELISTGAPTAIDAPFGWPQQFVELVSGWHASAVWPSDAPRTADGRRADRSALRFRRTDLHLSEAGLGRPLSVSTELVGVTALRCARLLQLAAERSGRPVQRAGGTVVEAYPALALRVFGLRSRGYKRADQAPLRRGMLDELARRGRLELCAATVERCSLSDHCLDALVCALVARAAAAGLTEPIPAAYDRRVVEAEGWIEIPVPGALERLADPA